MEYCAPDIIIYNEEGKPVAHCVYYNMMPVYFIGSYANVCGGCDSISTQDMICSLVRHFSQFGHVIFEGLLMSHIYSRYAALYEELAGFGIPFVFAFVDTPLDVCIERVKQRRLDKGNTKEFNTDNTVYKYDATWKSMKKFDVVGMKTCIIKHKKDPIAQIIKLLAMDGGLEFLNSYREESFR